MTLWQEISRARWLGALVMAIGCMASLLLSACTVSEPPVEHLSPHVPRPVVDVQIAPRGTVDLKDADVLMAPVFLADRQEELWRDSVTRLIHSILLQENTFRTLEISQDLVPTMEKLFREAELRGFDYLLIVDFSPILISACNTPGWLGMTMRLVSTADGTSYTLWQLYGEVILTPAPTVQGLLGVAQPRLAPTVGQGISVIARSMADILRRGAGPLDERRPIGRRAYLSTSVYFP